MFRIKYARPNCKYQPINATGGNNYWLSWKSNVQYSNTLSARNLRNESLLNTQSDVREINHCTLKSQITKLLFCSIYHKKSYHPQIGPPVVLIYYIFQFSVTFVGCVRFDQLLQYFFISHMISPIDLFHPPPTPHFKNFQVFLIYCPKRPSFSTI
jgi:hypothetical protein